MVVFTFDKGHGVFCLLSIGLTLLDSPPRDGDGTREHEEVDQDHEEAGTSESPDQTVGVI